MEQQPYSYQQPVPANYAGYQPGPVSVTLIDPVKQELLLKRIHNGGNWFFWVAGLSLINSVIQHLGGDISFVLGLAVTQILDAGFRMFAGSLGMVVSIFLDVIVAGLFVFFGVLARHRSYWGFVPGLALYALDGVLYTLLGSALAVVFHIYVLICIGAGFLAERELRACERT